MKVFDRPTLCKAVLVVITALLALMPRSAAADPSAIDSTNGAMGDFGEGLAVPQVGGTGAMTYSIPVRLPPPRGKERLPLAVAYNAHG